MNSMGSRCEWNWSTTVSGTFIKYSKHKQFLVKNLFSTKTNPICLPIINPTVTSSGNRIRSPMLINLPPPATGTIRKASALLMQNPAPPVANQKLTFGWGSCSLVWKIKENLNLNYHWSQIKILILPFPERSPAAKRHSAFPDTIPWPDCNHSAVGPVGARSHSCRRRSDRTIWKEKRTHIFY